MRILLAVHGWPDELAGGTESSARALALGLAGRGHAVSAVAGSLVPAGSLEPGTREAIVRESLDEDPSSGARVRVLRVHRPDLYFDHWQKGRSPSVAARFEEILGRLAPEVVHVHHWIRLSRDLVATAARAGIPSVVSLHDSWTSCLLTFRVRPDDRRTCEAREDAGACLECARGIGPPTPWVGFGEERVAFEERRADLARELELARAVCAPTLSHARSLEAWMGLGEGTLAARVLEPAVPMSLRIAEPLPPPAGSDPLVLSAWGSLTPIKGADLLVEAVRRLERERGAGAVRLHLAGEEPDPEHASELRASAGGLAVRFHGPYRAAELDRHPAARSHAMVSGSRARESFGLVLDEARALGLPAVLPRAGAFVERAGPGTGALLYEPGDAGSLAVALGRLIDEDGLLVRLRGEAARARRGAPGVPVEAALSIYEEAIRAGAPPAAPLEWFERRLQAFAIEGWDRALAAGPAAGPGPEDRR